MAWFVLLITNTLAVKVVLWHMGEPTNRYWEKFLTITNKYFIPICKVIENSPENTLVFSYIQDYRVSQKKVAHRMLKGPKHLPKLSAVGQNFTMDMSKYRLILLSLSNKRPNFWRRSLLSLVTGGGG